MTTVTQNDHRRIEHVELLQMFEFSIMSSVRPDTTETALDRSSVRLKSN